MTLGNLGVGLKMEFCSGDGMGAAASGNSSMYRRGRLVGLPNRVNVRGVSRAGIAMELGTLMMGSGCSESRWLLECASLKSIQGLDTKASTELAAHKIPGDYTISVRLSLKSNNSRQTSLIPISSFVILRRFNSRSVFPFFAKRLLALNLS